MLHNRQSRFVLVMMFGMALVAVLLAGLPATTANADSTPFTTAGTYTWTVPSGITAVTVEVWGGGGKGGTRANNGAAGGGGGGAYSMKANIAVTPGNVYTVVVGAGATTPAAGGDSYFGDTTTVLAKGGGSVTANNETGATGGQASAGVGDIRYSGGNGANGIAGSYGGGGGSSAGTSVTGTNAITATGAIAPTGGGNGGDGRMTSDGAGIAGSTPGGAGGGALRIAAGTQNGGNGAAGKVVITYKYNTTTSASCTPNPVAYGSDTSCTATVTRSGGSNTPGGAITWTLSGGDTGTFSPTACTLSGSGASASCSVTYTPGAVGDGTHGITATYGGDSSFNGSSGSQDVTVDKANQTISVGTPAPASAAYGSSFTVAATASSGLAVAYSSGTPAVCTNVGPLFTMVSSTGTCTVQYDQAGDANFNAAPQMTETVNAQKASTTTSLVSSANPSVFGANVTFTAAVAPSAATGTVQFYADGIALGSAATLSGGTADVSTSTLTVGTHVITATYSGDVNYSVSTGTLSPNQEVFAACTSVTGIDYSYSPTAPKVGQSVNFTATVTGGTAPITYTWNFGHGAPEVTTVAATVHSFPLTTTVHTYPVTLTAENDCTIPAVSTVKQVTVLPYVLYLPVILR